MQDYRAGKILEFRFSKRRRNDKRRPNRAAVISFALVILLAITTLPATATSLSSKLLDQWRWVEFTTADGLPSNHVTHIVETTDGVMWAATTRGLCRFDGYRWIQLDSRSGLPTGEISSLATGADGKIMVVINNSLFYGSQIGFNHVPVIAKTTPLRVDTVVAFAPGGYLIIAWNHDETRSDLFRWHNSEIHEFDTPARLSPNFPERIVQSLWTTPDGKTWLNSTDGVYRYINGHWEIWISASTLPLRITNLATDAEGNGILTVQGPFADQQTWKWSKQSYPYLSSNNVEELTKSLALGPGQQGIATHESGGVMYCHQGEWSILPSPPIQLCNPEYITYSSDGNIWVGTKRGLHVHQTSSNRWIQWKHTFPNRKNWINEFLVARDGSVWVATATGIDIHHPDGGTEYINEINGTPLTAVTGLAQDENDNIWVSSGGAFVGAYRWDGKHWTHFTTQSGFLPAYFHKIRTDSKNRLWFLGLARSPQSKMVISDADDVGVVILEKDRFTQWNTKNGLPSGRVYGFAESTEDGSLWFATLRGLARLKNGSWKYWTNETGLLGERIFALTIDKENRLWFCDENSGLGYIDDQDQPHYLTTYDGLISNHVLDLTTDKTGALWITTERGLNRYYNGTFSHFDAHHGLKNDRLWPVLAKNDKVYVGSSGGGTYILSLNEIDQPHPISIFNQPTIRKNVVRVSWRPLAYNGKLPSQIIETRFRLNGGMWSQWATQNQATFRNLKPGDYQLQVQAKGLFGGFYSAGNTLHFPIPTPFYFRAEYWVPITLLSILTVILSVSVISRRRRFKQALLHERNQYQAILDNTTAIICLKDTDGRYLVANRRFEDMLGVKRGEIIGKTAFDLFPSPLAQLLQDNARKVAQTGDAVEWEETIQLDDDTRTLLSTSCPLFDENGKVDSICVISTDITNRKSQEEDIRRTDKLDTLAILAAGIAHDFSGLVALISRHLELVRTSMPIQSPALHNLEVAEQAVRQANGMTKALQAVIHHTPPERKLVSLGAVCRDASKLLSHLIGVTVMQIWEITDEPLYVLADSTQLQQVLMNLVANARDAVPAGGHVRVTLTRWTPPAEAFGSISSPHYSHYAKINVSDNGVGIPQHVKNSIFEPMFTTKANQARTGLGLAIVARIIDDHEGWIDVDSEENVGTSISIFLPCENVEEHQEAILLEKDTARAPVDASVLVVDESQFERSLIATALRDIGYTVEQAGSGEQAVSIAQNSPKQFSIAVVNAELHDMSATGCIATMRQNGNLKHGLIIAEADDKETVDQASSMDIDIVSTPFLMKELLWAVAGILGNNHDPKNTLD